MILVSKFTFYSFAIFFFPMLLTEKKCFLPLPVGTIFVCSPPATGGSSAGTTTAKPSRTW